jgi:hypothetical protein
MSKETSSGRQAGVRWWQDSTPHMGRTIVDRDPQNRNFPAAGFIMQPGGERKSRTWRRSGPYDQGASSSCVGQTIKGLLNTQPLSGQVDYHLRNAYDAMHIYTEAQKYDEWPGENYDGTSAHGACKYLRQARVIDAYRWCFGLNDVVDTLCQYGPVGIGIRWHEGMMNVDSNGFVQPTGAIVGGHETELIGINVPHRYFVGMNSWGDNWGDKGRYKLSWDDLADLLHGDGDAVTIVSLAASNEGQES